jgi:hypothetical protein
MREIEQNLLTSIVRVDMTIFIVLWGLWFLASDIELFDLTYAIILLLIMIFTLTLISLEFRKILRNRALFKTDEHSKNLLFLEVAVSVVGFTLMGISAAILSIYFTVSSPISYAIHLYRSQSTILLVLGIFTSLAGLALFYYLLPKQLVHQKAVPQEETETK